MTTIKHLGKGVTDFETTYRDPAGLDALNPAVWSVRLLRRPIINQRLAAVCNWSPLRLHIQDAC